MHPLLLPSHMLCASTAMNPPNSPSLKGESKGFISRGEHVLQLSSSIRKETSYNSYKSSVAAIFPTTDALAPTCCCGLRKKAQTWLSRFRSCRLAKALGNRFKQIPSRSQAVAADKRTSRVAAALVLSEVRFGTFHSLFYGPTLVVAKQVGSPSQRTKCFREVFWTALLWCLLEFAFKQAVFVFSAKKNEPIECSSFAIPSPQFHVEIIYTAMGQKVYCPWGLQVLFIFHLTNRIFCCPFLTRRTLQLRKKSTVNSI